MKTAAGGGSKKSMKDYVKVKLKTGFFAKTEYRLRIRKEGLCFAPPKGGEKIVIEAAEIKSVTLHEPGLKMEILASDGLYEADINDYVDFRKMLQTLKENIDIKIVHEFN
jgi:hypothetical protein